MNLNYFAFFLISFVPLLIAIIWYRPNSFMLKWTKNEVVNPLTLSPIKAGIAFLLSVFLVYGYMNLVIHQLGFYELFFTDIMLGNEASKEVVDTFLAKYGQKHRHFGHGVLHGAINTFLFIGPFLGFSILLERKKKGYLLLHFSYWLVTSMVIGGLISAFI